MKNIRQAVFADAPRLAEIEIFCYRLNFYPIFRNDDFYFEEMTVQNLVNAYEDAQETLARTWVYDDGVVKGFVRMNGTEIEKLFVEPVLQENGIGAKLLMHAVTCGCDHLWALEKNNRAIAFYQRHGFGLTQNKKYEEDTTEFLIKMTLA